MLVGFAILLVTVAFIGGASAQEQSTNQAQEKTEPVVRTFSQCVGEQSCRSSCGCGGNPDACGCGG
ncbi:MAG: hypothetical protein JW754_06050 [Candidatus Aenigmarchaeota archaeon]|nr:hypothetical protein [Candidatus Aenigmarchaeota archaeon]